MSRILKREFQTNLINNLYFFIFLLACSAMYTGIPNGLIVGILLIALFIFYSFKERINERKSIIWWLIWSYIMYSSFTMIIANIEGFPLGIVFSEFANNIVPCLIYFIVQRMTKNDKNRFEKNVLFTSVLILISGLYYNLNLNDSAYLDFCARAYPNFSLTWFSLYPRLTSCLGSVVIAVVGVVGAAFALRILNEERSLLNYFYLIVAVSIAVLSMQRSAFIALVLISIGHAIRVNKYKYWFEHFKGIFFLIICILLLYYILAHYYPVVISTIFERLNMITSAYGERAYTWENAFDDSLFSLFFGHGLGSGGQRAIGVSLKTINDGNYFKMIYEIGIFGIFIFCSIIISILIKSIRYKKSFYYVLSMLMMLFQAIGSNILTFQSSAILFWYCLGCVDSE